MTVACAISYISKHFKQLFVALNFELASGSPWIVHVAWVVKISRFVLHVSQEFIANFNRFARVSGDKPAQSCDAVGQIWS